MSVYCVESFAHIECYSDCLRRGSHLVEPFGYGVISVCSTVTRREVEHALQGMPEKKTPGPDGITTEMLVAAGEVRIL